MYCDSSILIVIHTHPLFVKNECDTQTSWLLLKWQGKRIMTRFFWPTVLYFLPSVYYLESPPQVLIGLPSTEANLLFLRWKRRIKQTNHQQQQEINRTILRYHTTVLVCHVSSYSFFPLQGCVFFFLKACIFLIRQSA